MARGSQQDRQDTFLSSIAAGDDFRHALKKARIKAVTFARWRLTCPEFVSRLSEAHQLRDALILEQLYEDARSGDTAARKAYLDASRKAQDAAPDGPVQKLYGFAAREAVEAV